MANADIDTLVLNIEVNDKKDGETVAKKLSTLNSVLGRFQKTVKQLDTTAFKQKFASMANSIKPFVNQLNSAKATLVALDSVLAKMGSSKLSVAASVTQPAQKPANESGSAGGDLPEVSTGDVAKLAEDAKKQRKQVEDLTKSYGDLIKTIRKADNTQTQYYERFEGNNRVLTKVVSDLDKEGKVVAGTAKVINESFEDVGGDSLKAFVLSIKRIGLYRMIRTTLKLTTQALETGIANITSFSADARQSMSELTSSLMVLKNSVGVVVMPLLQLVTPLIQGISKAVGSLANAISYLIAKLKGQSTYLKVNTDYLKEYNKQSSLLSFDEFSSLRNDQDTTGMFTEESIEGGSFFGLLAEGEKFSAVLAGISATLLIIGGAKIIGLITGGSLLRCIKNIGTSLLGFMGSISGLAVGIGVLVTGLVSFIASWDEMSTTAKVLIPIIATLTAVLVGLAVAHAAAKAGLAAPAMAGITAAAIAAGIVLAAGAAIATKSYANGGMFEGTGTLYHQVGEAGAEIVATGSRGTGVTNINQFKQAMIEALQDYNAAQNREEIADVVINLDGKELARQQVKNNADALRKTYNIALNPR